jgi:cyclophilin family peptidyl-prolyl cis-trans isomerase
VSVAVETTKGVLVIKLRPDLAPATVANFLSLAEKNFYDGVAFHRVVPGFVNQTGDPSGTSYGGPGYTIRCELSDAPYERGTVGMALAGPDTGGSQFFITYSAQPHLERHYTVFGRVVEGIEVLDSLQPWDRIVRMTRR